MSLLLPGKAGAGQLFTQTAGAWAEDGTYLHSILLLFLIVLHNLQ